MLKGTQALFANLAAKPMTAGGGGLVLVLLNLGQMLTLAALEHQHGCSKPLVLKVFCYEVLNILTRAEKESSSCLW